MALSTECSHPVRLVDLARRWGSAAIVGELIVGATDIDNVSRHARSDDDEVPEALLSEDLSNVHSTVYHPIDWERERERESASVLTERVHRRTYH